MTRYFNPIIKEEEIEKWHQVSNKNLTFCLTLGKAQGPKSQTVLGKTRASAPLTQQQLLGSEGCGWAGLEDTSGRRDCVR